MELGVLRVSLLWLLFCLLEFLGRDGGGEDRDTFHGQVEFRKAFKYQCVLRVGHDLSHFPPLLDS